MGVGVWRLREWGLGGVGVWRSRENIAACPEQPLLFLEGNDSAHYEMA